MLLMRRDCLGDLHRYGLQEKLSWSDRLHSIQAKLWSTWVGVSPLQDRSFDDTATANTTSTSSYLTLCWPFLRPPLAHSHVDIRSSRTFQRPCTRESPNHSTHGRQLLLRSDDGRPFAFVSVREAVLVVVFIAKGNSLFVLVRPRIPLIPPYFPQINLYVRSSGFFFLNAEYCSSIWMSIHIVRDSRIKIFISVASLLKLALFFATQVTYILS